MKTIRIKFPQITIEIKEIEVSEDQYEDLIEHSSDEEKANFIWDNMTEQEQSWTNGKKWIEDAIDVGYCGIYRRLKTNEDELTNQTNKEE